MLEVEECRRWNRSEERENVEKHLVGVYENERTK
jgi:hypothetical protein